MIQILYKLLFQGIPQFYIEYTYFLLIFKGINIVSSLKKNLSYMVLPAIGVIDKFSKRSPEKIVTRNFR